MRCSMLTLLLFLVGETGIEMDGAQNPNPLSYRIVVLLRSDTSAPIECNDEGTGHVSCALDVTVGL